MEGVDQNTTIRSLLESRARADADHVYCRYQDQELTLQALNRRVNRFANGLSGLGIGPEDRVAVMLPNTPLHLLAILSLAKIGAVQVPINTRLKSAGIEYLMEHSQPKALVADARFADQVEPVLRNGRLDVVIWQSGSKSKSPGVFDAVEIIASGGVASPPHVPRPDDVLCISYTSGTSGPPKGVMVTDKMLRACATGAAVAADTRPDDVLLLWEPLYHIGGSQVAVLGLTSKVTLALVERFSASQFWGQVRQHRATQIHYLGGILQMLLRQPARPDDGENPVRVAWGGGCPSGVWREFERRFDLKIHENYGMTESASIVTVNTRGRVGSIGKPLPYFDVRVVDEADDPLGPGEKGELLVREKEPNLIMKGYFKSPKSTEKALRDGWLHTGDLGYYDREGFFYYAGRRKDSVRCRGENVSAWEVEQTINAHPGVEESAMVGVASDIGEEDIKVFVRTSPDRPLEPSDLVRWCEDRMAYFQVPRYVTFIGEFQKTPTERIKKEALSRSVSDCWDRTMGGYTTETSKKET